MGIKSSFLKIKKRLGISFWAWVGFFISPFIIYGIWQMHDFLVNDGDLVVAFCTALPPNNSYKEVERKNHGFDFSIAYFVAQRLHKNLKIKEIPFSESIKQLKAGTIDLICASLSITDERLTDMAMVHVYGGQTSCVTMVFGKSSFYDELAPLAQQEVPAYKVQSLLQDVPIGCLADSVWASILKKYSFNNIRNYTYEQDLIAALESGAISAAVIGGFAANFLHKQNSNIQTFDIAFNEPWSHGAGIAIKKDRYDLIQNVRQTIKDLKDEGVIRQEQLRWFGRVCDE